MTPAKDLKQATFVAFLTDFEPWDGSQRLVNGRGMRGVDSQVLATILDQFETICTDLGPDQVSET